MPYTNYPAGDLRTLLTSRVKASKNFIYFLAEGTRPSSTDAWVSFMFRFGNKISGQTKSLSIYKNFEWMPTYGGGVWGATPNSINDFTILEDQDIDFTAIFATMADKYVAGNLVMK